MQFIHALYSTPSVTLRLPVTRYWKGNFSLTYSYILSNSFVLLSHHPAKYISVFSYTKDFFLCDSDPELNLDIFVDEMSSSSTPSGSLPLPRPRTRNQWNKYLKKSVEVSVGSKGKTIGYNLDSECYILDEDVARSDDFITITDESSFEGRSENGDDELTGSMKIENNRRKRRKKDTYMDFPAVPCAIDAVFIEVSDGDDDVVEYVSEEVSTDVECLGDSQYLSESSDASVTLLETDSTSDDDSGELSDEEEDYKLDESSPSLNSVVSDSDTSFEQDNNDDDDECHAAAESKKQKNSSNDTEERRARRKNPEKGSDIEGNKKCSPRAPVQVDDNESESSSDEGRCHVERVVKGGKQCSKKAVKLSKKKACALRKLDLVKILLESLNSGKDVESPLEKVSMTDQRLPLKFRFEDEMEPPQEKTEREKHFDSLYCELELMLRLGECETDCNNILTTENEDTNAIAIDENQAACCSRGKHQFYLDEQIGLLCRCCPEVIDIKDIMPEFYVPPPDRRIRKLAFDESPSTIFDQVDFHDSVHRAPGSATTRPSGTVWDLVPGVEEQMYPHQREGFEFMWTNIAGDIRLEKLKEPPSDGGRGCIISHAPGTGKTRLSIVFLQSLLKQYATCRLLIIAPRGTLLTWESEFTKWNFSMPFHNLNKKELSGSENAFASNLIRRYGGRGLDTVCIRLLKLLEWRNSRSVLGMSYTLFEKLAGENVRGEQNEQVKKLLLELPGLLVLDEGHTPRNKDSLIWKVFMKVATKRRIILSGTPFQNNLKELHNTLCLVNPKMIDSELGAEASTRHCTKNKDGEFELKMLKDMLRPLVHVHKGTILHRSIPGLRCTLVYLHPTTLQEILLKEAIRECGNFDLSYQVSLISVHPWLALEKPIFLRHKSELEKHETDIYAGVKLHFLIELIRLADALDERVLVFSQYIPPLQFIMKRIQSSFNWHEDKEILYMDGKLDEKQRQRSIYSFNKATSSAKVLLASERACSEGINLIGASRVVLLDTVWNPSVEKQAISRAYRLGQKKMVYVYRLFTSGTEVKQYAQQVEKKRISELLFSPLDGQQIHGDKTQPQGAWDWEDKLLDPMLELETLQHIFEKVVRQGNESDFVDNLGLDEQ